MKPIRSWFNWLFRSKEIIGQEVVVKDTSLPTKPWRGLQRMKVSRHVSTQVGTRVIPDKHLRSNRNRARG